MNAWYEALFDALAISDTPGRTTRSAWYAEAVRIGLAAAISPADDYRMKDRKLSHFRKYLSILKIKGRIGVDGEIVNDLRKAPGRTMPS